MAGIDNLTPFTKDDNRASEAGKKGKPGKHISTWIQEMLNDEEFTTTLLDSKKGVVEYKGAPLKAIIGVAIHKSINDPKTGNQWAEWLAKHGYGSRTVLEIDNPIDEILKKYGLKDAGQIEETQDRSPKDTA